MDKMFYYVWWLLLALTGCQNAPLPQHQTIQPQLINPPGVLTNANTTYGVQSQGGFYSLSTQYNTDNVEIRSLLEQQFIDPITHYIEENRSHPTKSSYISQLEAERQRRCREVADWYAQKPRTMATLNRLTTGYSYSCPQVVGSYSMNLAGMSNVKPHNMPNPPYPPSASGVASQPTTISRQVQADDQAKQYPVQPITVVTPTPIDTFVPAPEQTPTTVAVHEPVNNPVNPVVSEVTIEPEPEVEKELPDRMFKVSPVDESEASTPTAPPTTDTAGAQQPLQKGDDTMQELYPWLYEAQ